MKITFEFDNEIDARLALNGPKYWSALWEFREKLRTLQKHGLPKHIKTPFDAFEWCEELFYDAAKDVDWDEIP